MEDNGLKVVDTCATCPADDKLGRNRMIGPLTNLVRNNSNPLVIGIDSPWGTGKTYFLQMWKAFLEGWQPPTEEGEKISIADNCVHENIHARVIYFNAWENDYADDPFASFIGELDDLFVGKGAANKLKSQLKDAWKITKENAVKIILNCATRGAFSNLPIPYGDILDADYLAGEAAQITFALISNHKKAQNVQAEFANSLGKCAEIVKKDSGGFPLIIMVDELDRCRPDFAISLLERIKHLFHIPNVVFVLAVDREALCSAIAHRYGEEYSNSRPENREMYLDRFFSHWVHLPYPSYQDYAVHLFRENDFQSALARWEWDGRYSVDWRKNFQKGLPDIILFPWFVFAKLSRALRLTLRQQNTTYAFVDMMLRSVSIIPWVKSDIDAKLVSVLFPLVIAFLRSANENILRRMQAGEDVGWSRLIPVNRGNHNANFDGYGAITLALMTCINWLFTNGSITSTAEGPIVKSKTISTVNAVIYDKWLHKFKAKLLMPPIVKDHLDIICREADFFGDLVYSETASAEITAGDSAEVSVEQS